ncbi:MAG: signal peptidase II [Lachnospiraceae bacterium]|nr:signal peptidase II [Lachnospiraceae bacterium]
MAALLVILLIFVSDLCIKDYIEKHKELEKDEEILDGKIIITKYHNKGAFLNAMEKNRKLLLTVSGIFFGLVVLVLAFLIPQKRKGLLTFVVALIAGGASSNMYDRIRRGYVVDYFSFSFLKKVVFNISDIFIFIGSIIASVYAIMKS